MLRYLTAIRTPYAIGCLTLAGAAFAYPGCDDGGDGCRGGSPCGCSSTDDCYLECGGPDCDLTVHDLVHGGGVCDDHCSYSCFAVNDCSLSCGNHCSSQVHDTVSTGTLCESDCEHECFDVDRCGVSAGANSHVRCHNLTTCEVEPVGPGSTVECHSVNTCRVVCTGQCRVEYTALGSGEPELVCPPSAELIQCSETAQACGACGD